MPWRPDSPDEVPTLGYLVGEWIEEFCVVPDGELGGSPFLLTEEMWTFLAHHYRLRTDATEGQLATAFTHRRSMLVRPQKWGKGPLTAAIVCAESVGPSVFAGWDAGGRPLARERATPRIQITASSEDQTGNVYGHLLPMIQRGPLTDLIPDAGITRTNLPYGGHVEPVTSKARSRLGAPITFAIQDETGTWTTENGGQALADTQRRGLAGMSGRSIETTNAWDPAEQSVAQRGYESKVPDIYRDFPVAPGSWSYTNKQERRRIHRFAYGDSWWVDLDAIEADAVELLERDPAQAERFYGNRIVVGSGAWIRDGLWESAYGLAS